MLKFPVLFFFFLLLAALAADTVNVETSCCPEEYGTFYFQRNGSLLIVTDEQKTKIIPAEDAKDMLKFSFVDSQTVQILKRETTVNNKECTVYHSMTMTGRTLPTILTCKK